MDPVSAIAFGSKALGFLRRNWSLVLLGVVAAWGAWQYVGRVEAEGALADQKLQTAVDANATWVELEDKREAFEGEVREGLKNLRNTVSDLQAANTAFAAKVQSNANSRRALDPVERDALRLLADPGGGEAGGGAVPPPSHLRVCADAAGTTDPAKLAEVGELLVAYSVERSGKVTVIACNAEIIRLIDVHNATMQSGKLTGKD